MFLLFLRAFLVRSTSFAEHPLCFLDRGALVLLQGRSPGRAVSTRTQGLGREHSAMGPLQRQGHASLVRGHRVALRFEKEPAAGWGGGGRRKYRSPRPEPERCFDSSARGAHISLLSGRTRRGCQRAAASGVEAPSSTFLGEEDGRPASNAAGLR